MEDYVDRALDRRQKGEHYPFVTWSRELGRVVGSTRFYDMAAWDWTGVFAGSEQLRRTGRGRRDQHRLHVAPPIGASAAAVNTEAKVLMMAHAFECWQVRAVRLKTDARNARSRSAIVGSAAASTGSCDPSGRARTARCVTRRISPCWPTNGRTIADGFSNDSGAEPNPWPSATRFVTIRASDVGILPAQSSLTTPNALFAELCRHPDVVATSRAPLKSPALFAILS